MGRGAAEVGNDSRARDAAATARLGVLAAVLSSSVGGMNTAVTRYAIGATDPVTLAALRFGLGFILLMPIALAFRSRWPQRRDWIGVLGLGILFFGLFMGLFNLSLRYTTAGRGALALSTLPLLTMVVGAALRIEPLGARKAIGVLVAMAGVALALVTGLEDAPAGAWRGDAIMVAAALCYALYNVWSRPFIARSDSLAFVTAGMGAGSACLALLAWSSGGFRGGRRIWLGAMERRPLSRRHRRRPDFFPLGLRLGADDSDASRQHDHAQSGDGLDRRRDPAGRADRTQSGRRRRRRLRRHLARLDGSARSRHRQSGDMAPPPAVRRPTPPAAEPAAALRRRAAVPRHRHRAAAEGAGVAVAGA